MPASDFVLLERICTCDSHSGRSLGFFKYCLYQIVEWSFISHIAYHYIDFTDNPTVIHGKLCGWIMVCSFDLQSILDSFNYRLRVLLVNCYPMLASKNFWIFATVTAKLSVIGLHERIRTIHSHIKDAKKTIDSLIESSYSVASLEDYDSKRIELRRSLTHFQTTIGTYSTTIASLRRQVDKMKSDTPEQQDSKKKEQKLFVELRTGDDGGIDYDDVSLSESLLPSIISVVDQTLAFAKSDAMTKMEIEARKESIHQAMSIQSQPVHDSTTTQFTPILTQNEHMSTVISTLIERLNAPPLPPITLIPFDGESTQWESFYSQYSSEIGAMSHLSDHAKLVYLRNALTGAALRSVEGIPIEGKNLKSTIDRLKSVYGRSKRSNTILINQLFSIRPKSFTLEDQLECTQQLINKIHQLEDQSMVDNFALIN
ncbi:hypothetical protein PRIPAC_78197 [Pristionchus pacificus]|uniref:Uncharacterized protein n=1 Tax=Pristionchus pacificus TaxID=54126 RepID=A0A2A6CPF5_PRIPA|nr:hypothetical protein PRIPAC_78197 [Pristionchus pacificus]|eukprot:PDM79986.1 hypothetical protein PRIPAC_32565 [Pristionchus pacificus]